MVSQLLDEGSKKITVQKEGYACNEEYIIDVVQNPNYYIPYVNLNINPYDSLVGYDTRGLPNQTYEDNSLYRIPENYQAVYSSVPAYTFRIRKFINEVLQTDYSYEIDKQDKKINFTLTQNIIADRNPTDPLVEKIKLNMAVEGPNSSVLVVKDGTGITNEKFNLNAGVTNFEDVPTSDLVYSIQTSDINLYRITKIVVSGEGLVTKTLEATSGLESISTKIKAERDLNISITTENFTIVQATIPSVAFLNLDRLASKEFTEYNINSNADVPIGLNLFGGTNMHLM
jgi:hypothetical protein